MKILDSRRDQTSSEKRRKMRVDILGRGTEDITISPTNTVGELRSSLQVDGNVRAVDSDGNILNDTDKLGNLNEINFVPNVKGGGDDSPPFPKVLMSKILRRLLLSVEGTPVTHIDKIDFRYSNDMSDENTVFSCNRPPIKIIEEKSSNGLFPVGIRVMFDFPDVKKQYKLAKKLSYIDSVTEKMDKAVVNLKEFGKYEVFVEKMPKAFRRNYGKDTFANPYINKDTNHLCLGNSLSLYNQCFLSGNYLESLKLIQEVLKSEPDGTQNIYRRWEEC